MAYYQASVSLASVLFDEAYKVNILHVLINIKLCHALSMDI